jgi:hypothetical protein
MGTLVVLLLLPLLSRGCNNQRWKMLRRVVVVCAVPPAVAVGTIVNAAAIAIVVITAVAVAVAVAVSSAAPFS